MTNTWKDREHNAKPTLVHKSSAKQATKRLTKKEIKEGIKEYYEKRKRG